MPDAALTHPLHCARPCCQASRFAPTLGPWHTAKHPDRCKSTCRLPLRRLLPGPGRRCRPPGPPPERHRGSGVLGRGAGLPLAAPAATGGHRPAAACRRLASRPPCCTRCHAAPTPVGPVHARQRGAGSLQQSPQRFGTLLSGRTLCRCWRASVGSRGSGTAHPASRVCTGRQPRPLRVVSGFGGRLKGPQRLWCAQAKRV